MICALKIIVAATLLWWVVFIICVVTLMTALHMPY